MRYAGARGPGGGGGWVGEERRACNNLSQIFTCTSPRLREIPLAKNDFLEIKVDL